MMSLGRIIIGTSLGLSVAFGTATSCIIPDKEISLVQVCGTRWYGIANGAKGVNQSGFLVDILVSSDWVRGSFCVWPHKHKALEEGVALDCLQHDNQQDCQHGSWCIWWQNIHGTDTDVCLPNDASFVGPWWEVVEAGIAACEAAAADENVEPYPDCGAYETQMECDSHSNYCVWNDFCFRQDVLNCKTATVLTQVETEDEWCTQVGVDECAVAGTGDTGGGGGGDDHGDDGSPWGDLSAQISCSGSVCDVDGQLISAIWANSTPLIDDYDARLSFDDNGSSIHGMRINRISTGDLPDHLGLQNDDLIYEVNGLPVTDEIDLLIAADVLNDAVSATVKIWRGSTTITRWYNLAGECVPIWDPCESDYECCGGAICSSTWEICDIPLSP